MSEHEDSHSDEEDTGRLQSESLMRRGATMKWLDDVLERTDADYKEVMEGIERERETITRDEELLTSLEQVFRNERVDEAGASPPSNNNNNNTTTTTTAHTSTTNLLSASTTLLDLYTRATTSTQLARATVEETWHEHNATLLADRKLMKKILAAGKRMVEREIESLEQTEADSDAEEERQARAIFNGREKDGGMGWGKGSGSGTRTLKYVEKGVRKMVKGLEE